MQKSMIEFVTELEREIYSAIGSSFPAEWDENFITMHFLKCLRNAFSFRQILSLQEGRTIDWGAYKYNGKVENKHGDIGVLVKISYRDGSTLEGVGFLEAKKRYAKTFTFNAISTRQLEHMRKESPKTLVLLYDYEDITGFVWASSLPIESLGERYLASGMAIKPITRALVMSTDVVIRSECNDINLYKFGVPLSHQLALRYMNGLDLDFRKDVIDLVKGYNADHGLCSYVLQISISQIGAASKKDDMPINMQVYERLET